MKSDKELRAICDKLPKLGPNPTGEELMDLLGDLTGEELNRIKEMETKAATVSLARVDQLEAELRDSD